MRSQNYSESENPERDAENDLREQFGYPKVGEQWLSESLLYNIVKVLFPEHEVIHHYRGKELERLELDIWLPELSLGIEYQGVQHYQVVEHWGGEAGLKKRIANDKRKKILCKKLGYDLVEFIHSESLDESLVKRKLHKYMQAGT